MFTGLIHCIGRVRGLHDRQHSRILEISHDLADIPLTGASVAVNGVCLTVLSGQKHIFTAECFFSTLDKTGFKNIRPGASVHLEPALKIGSPLDGHLVQGHVSSRTRVLENRWVGRGRMLTLKIPAGEGGFLIPEGSVALDGVSLTISSLEEDRFSIQLIGETLKSTCLGMLNPGDRVNLETDMLLRGSKQKLGTSGNQKPNITEQQLLQWGYL